MATRTSRTHSLDPDTGNLEYYGGPPSDVITYDSTAVLKSEEVRAGNNLLVEFRARFQSLKQSGYGSSVSSVGNAITALDAILNEWLGVLSRGFYYSQAAAGITGSNPVVYFQIDRAVADRLSDEMRAYKQFLINVRSGLQRGLDLSEVLAVVGSPDSSANEEMSSTVDWGGTGDIGSFIDRYKWPLLVGGAVLVFALKK